jgi:protoporphyrinogen oxidase
MRIGIIGAGFTGLTAAYRLSQQGHQVVVFEKEKIPGGLAIGFSGNNWDWQLEKHYHHWFESDSSVLSLAREINYKVNFIRPITATFVNKEITQLDSPSSLLKFNHLSFADRFRTAFGLSLLKFSPLWKPFEKITAKSFIQNIMGKKSWEVLWEPLFKGKFGEYANTISAVWFWSRIYKRSETLGYPEGGFQSFANSIEKVAKKHGVTFRYNVQVDSVHSNSDKTILINTNGGKSQLFDRVVNTLPTPIVIKMTPDLPAEYAKKYAQLKGLGAVNLVLSLKHQLLSKTYWLNINDRQFPFLAVVEHTNFISPIHYNNEHIVYIGNYLPSNHRYFSFDSTQLLKEFTPYIKKINPSFSPKWINASWAWRAPYAQPIVTTNYSQYIPPLTSPITNLYLANMQQVYPWDRGTNYAVELGNKVASLCDTE